MPRQTIAFLILLLGAFALCRAATEAPAAAKRTVDSLLLFREEIHPVRKAVSCYGRFREYLPWARGKGLVDTLFGLFLHDLASHGSSGDGTRDALVDRWVRDALEETHEETRLWYSLGMNEVRGVFAGGVSMGHFKIRPGSEMDVTWFDPEKRSPPPPSMRVQVARFDGKDPALPGAYVPMDSGGFKTEGYFHVFRKKLARPGVYRVTVHGKDFFQQAYVQVGWLDLAVKDDGERFLAWAASPGNRVKPPYRIRVEGTGYAKDTLTDSSGLLLLDLPEDSAFRRSLRIAAEKDGNGAWSRGMTGEAAGKELKGILFTDRPRYRPGDALHIRGLGKWLADERVLSDGWRGPVELKVFDGRWRLIFQRRLEVDPWGNFGDSLRLPEDAALGNWRAVASRPEEEPPKPGGKAKPPEVPHFEWTAEFAVEEYRKPDFRMEGNLAWHEKGKVVLEVQGSYYNGAPLAGIPVEIRWYSAPRFRPYLYWRRHFGGGGARLPYSTGDFAGRALLRTDTLRLRADGRGRFEGPSPAPEDAGALAAELVGRDATGREVRAWIQTDLRRKGAALRVETDRFRYEAGDAAWIRVEDGTKAGQAAGAKVLLKLEKDGKAFLDTSLALESDRTGVLRLPIAKAGQYALRCVLAIPGRDTLRAETRFLAIRLIGSGTADDLRLSLRRGLTAGRDSLRFDLHGRWGASPILATLEGGSLGAWRILRSPDASHLAASLPLPAQAARKARISVLYPGPLDWKRDSADVELPDTTFLLKATLEASRAWKPGDRFAGRLRVTDAQGRPAKVRFSLGVVDEAIYAQGMPPQGQVGSLVPARTTNRVRTRFGEGADDYLWAIAGARRTPRGARTAVPEEYHPWIRWDHDRWDQGPRYKKRRGAHFTFGPTPRHIGYSQYEDTAYVVMKLDGGYSEFSGAGTPVADPPRQRSEFRDYAFWNSFLSTDADGSAAVEFPWPDDLTRWRLRARGAGPGAALLDFTDTLLTRQDIMVRLAAPRTFTAGDSALVTAMVRNGTGRPLEAEVRFESGDSSVAVPADSGYRKLSLRAGSVALAFPLRVLKPGKAVLRMVLRTPSGGDAEERAFPVHGRGIRHVTASAGIAKGTWEWTLPQGYESGTAGLEVEIFSSPALALAGPVGALLEYPYGCVEQTMSRFLPLLEVAALYKRMGIRDTALERKKEPYARRGLDRLEALSREGWSWWSDGPMDPGMTAWIVEGLELARRAGLPADLQLRAESLRRRGLKALGEGLNATRHSPEELVAAVHALAAGGSAAKWRTFLIRPWEKRNGLDIRSLALLLETYHGAGMKAEEAAILALLRSKLKLPERRGHFGGFAYPEREIMDIAAALGALMAAAPEDGNIPRLSGWLFSMRQGLGWGSTRATAAVLSVLSRHVDARAAEAAGGTVAMELNGRLLRADTVRLGHDGTWSLRFAVSGAALEAMLDSAGNNRVTVRHEGPGRLHYSALLSMRAAPAPPAADSALPLKVTRTYRKVRYERKDGALVRKSAPLGDRALKPGDEVEVVLQVDCPQGGGYAMVEDPYPAGMEHLPGDMQETASTPWSGRRRYEHFEARDDRAVFFQSRLDGGRTTFRYLLRAETRGRFTARPARAELMYAPEINGHSRPAEFSVRP